MGRYGPYVAVGDPDDESAKPKFFGLRPGQRIDTITLEEAMALTKLPRQLGASPDGVAVSTNIGRFGPYIRHGDKFVSLKAEDDPYTLTLERALELIEAKKLADAARELKIFPDTNVRVLNGRFGPYVTDGSKNARIPKDQEPAALTLEQCQELLLTAKPAFGRGRKPAKPAAKPAKTAKPKAEKPPKREKPAKAAAPAKAAKKVAKKKAKAKPKARAKAKVQA